MERMFLDYSKCNVEHLTSEDFTTIHENSYNGIVLDNVQDDVPLPWDAEVSIQGETAIIQGGVGACGFGNVKVELPKAQLKNYYKIFIEPCKDKEQIIEDTLKKYNIEVIV